MKKKIEATWVFAHGKLFACSTSIITMSRKDTIIECYDHDGNLWKEITQIPLEMLLEGPRKSREHYIVFNYSIRVLKEHAFLEQGSLSE